MAFSDFNLRSAVETFGLQEDRDSDLFAQVAPLDISEFTRSWLDEIVAHCDRYEYRSSSQSVHHRSTPGRSEATVQKTNQCISGIHLRRGPRAWTERILRLPYCSLCRRSIITFVRGDGGCRSQTRRRDWRAWSVCGHHGCVCRFQRTRWQSCASGLRLCQQLGWRRFLRLEGTRLNIDRPEYYLDNAGKIVGIFVSMLGENEGV